MQPHGYLYAARGGATIARHPRPAEEGRRRRHRASDVDRNARADRATHRRPRRDTVVTHCCGRRRHLRTILYVRYAIRPPCTLRAARPLAALARRRAPAIVIIYTGRALFVRVGSQSTSRRPGGLLAPDYRRRSEPQTDRYIISTTAQQLYNRAQRAIYDQVTSAAGSGGHPPAYASVLLRVAVYRRTRLEFICR